MRTVLPQATCHALTRSLWRSSVRNPELCALLPAGPSRTPEAEAGQRRAASWHLHPRERADGRSGGVTHGEVTW